MAKTKSKKTTQARRGRPTRHLDMRYQLRRSDEQWVAWTTAAADKKMRVGDWLRHVADKAAARA